MIQGIPLQKRVLLASPVVIAFAFHAIALGRWLLVGPALIGLGVAVMRTSAFIPAARHWYFVAGAGLLVGILVPSSTMTAGPLPSNVAGAIAGIAVAVAILATLGNKTTIAWAAAWAVLAMSGKHTINGQLNLTLFAFLLASLVAASSNAGLLRFRRRSLLTLGLFAVLTAISTGGISLALKYVDRALVNTVENMMARNPASSITGLSNSISLGKRTTITPSPKPLLELSEKSGVLRTKVLDNFDGLRWTTSQQLNKVTQSFDDVWVDKESKRELEILFLDDINNALPSPAGTYQVVDATPRVSGGWVLKGQPDRVTVTMVGSAVEQLPSEPEPNATLLSVPESLIEGLGPLAAELIDPSKTNRQNAEAIAAFFQHNFEYSLTTDLYGDDHPLVTLVNERRPAYCVYFASAMAVMLRTQGIPTRLVSGFVPNEVNPLTGRVVVRSRDAHAWVEVWSPQSKRYHAFDPTPSASRMQATGLNKPDRFFASVIQAIRSTVRRFWLFARRDPLRMLWILFVSPYTWLALAAFALWCIRKLRRTTKSPTVDQPRLVDPEIQEVYDRYLGSLRQAGVTPQPWESEEELIGRLHELGNASVAKAATDFITRYRATRFGGEAFNNELRSLATLVSAAGGRGDVRSAR